MNFTRTEIEDIIICAPQVHSDDRGYFAETFRQDKLEEFIGRKINFCQDNETKSEFGVLRGLHHQVAPFTQAKLVRVVEGAILDVVVDIRKGSPTFGKHIVVELSGENKKQIFIPRGFTHGYQVISEHAIVTYKVDGYYSNQCDKGISYNDPDLNIAWPILDERMILSTKDTQQPSFKETNDLFDYNVDYYG